MRFQQFVFKQCVLIAQEELIEKTRKSFIQTKKCFLFKKKIAKERHLIRNIIYSFLRNCVKEEEEEGEKQESIFVLKILHTKALIIINLCSDNVIIYIFYFSYFFPLTNIQNPNYYCVNKQQLIHLLISKSNSLNGALETKLNFFIINDERDTLLFVRLTINKKIKIK